MIRTSPRVGRLDFIGSIVSLLCAIHCLAFPLLISWGSLLTLSAYEHDVIEPLFLSMGLILCVWSVSSSYKIHRRTLPIILFVISVTLIIIGRLFTGEVVEIFTNSSAAILLAAAHFYNRKFVKTRIT